MNPAPLIAALIAALAPLAPPPMREQVRHVQVICYFGKNHQPGGCVTVHRHPPSTGGTAMRTTIPAIEPAET